MPFRLASIAPSLPPTPVSTIVTSPARASRYAETKPRLTRVHATAPVAAEPPPDGGAVDALPLGVELGLVPPPLGAQPAMPRTATASAPRPRSARNRRRVTNG